MMESDAVSLCNLNAWEHKFVGFVNKKVGRFDYVNRGQSGFKPGIISTLKSLLKFSPDYSR